MSLTDILAANPSLRTRGFLPAEDPFPAFPDQSPFGVLDRIGDDLPGLLKKGPAFRTLSQVYRIPLWPADCVGPEYIPALELYFLRLVWWAAAYIHQISEGPVDVLPSNIAVPLAHAAALLKCRPILAYRSYTLRNWRRIDPARPIELGNIETFQNSVDLCSKDGVNQESWFILNHVDQEEKASGIVDPVGIYVQDLEQYGEGDIDWTLQAIAASLADMIATLKRIPEHMDPDLYFSTFRPYINGYFDEQFPNGVLYEGTGLGRVRYRGETGAQSSIMPLLEAFLKIPHKPSMLTMHLADMRNYMPALHREVLEATDALPDISLLASKEPWNAVLELMAKFREIHLGYARDYIDRHGSARGTGGTPFMKWLAQLIKETREAMKT